MTRAVSNRESVPSEPWAVAREYVVAAIVCMSIAVSLYLAAVWFLALAFRGDASVGPLCPPARSVSGFLFVCVLPVVGTTLLLGLAQYRIVRDWRGLAVDWPSSCVLAGGPSSGLPAVLRKLTDGMPAVLFGLLPVTPGQPVAIAFSGGILRQGAGVRLPHVERDHCRWNVVAEWSFGEGVLPCRWLQVGLAGSRKSEALASAAVLYQVTETGGGRWILGRLDDVAKRSFWSVHTSLEAAMNRLAEEAAGSPAWGTRLLSDALVGPEPKYVRHG